MNKMIRPEYLLIIILSMLVTALSLIQISETTRSRDENQSAKCPNLPIQSIQID